MKKAMLGAVALLLAVSGLAVAQPTGDSVFTTSFGPGQDPVWVDSEALLWWIKKNPVHVPLVTTGSATDTPPGAISQPGTSVIFGNEDVDMGMFAGGRFTMGYWLGSEDVFAFEGNYFFLSGKTVSRSVSSDGSRILTNPFYNITTPGEDSSLIAFPGLLSGNSTLSLYSFLEGAEINALYNFIRGPNGRLGFLAGFRFLDLHERLGLASNSTGIPGGPFDGFTVAQNDVFETRNLFYGGQIGLQGEWRYERLFIDAVAKVAFGCMHQTEDISGAPGALISVPPPPPPPPPPPNLDDGEVYATSTNAGHHTHQTFGCVSEFDITLGYQLTQRLRLYAGYSLLLVNEVIRPGDQIDRVINPTQFTGPLVGPARPQVLFNESFFWAQGLNLGFELTF